MDPVLIHHCNYFHGDCNQFANSSKGMYQMAKRHNLKMKKLSRVGRQNYHEKGEENET